MDLLIDIDIAGFFRKSAFSYWGNGIGGCGGSSSGNRRQVAANVCALKRWRYGLSAQMGFVMPRYARLGVIRRGARLVARVLSDKLRYVWYCTLEEGNARLRYSRRHVCRNPKWAPCSNPAIGSL